MLKMASLEAAGQKTVSNAGTQRNVMTGNLPPDFLRVDGIPAGPPMVVAPQPMFTTPYGLPTYYQKGGVLSVTVVQARLAKNYGFTRMDPYCRLRIGNSIFETQTDNNGAKNPRWNKLMQLPLPEGINQIYVEIFDESTFTVDERIAWGMITIKDEIFAGETVDDWYTLSGKQGEDKEGMINIIFHYREGPVAVAPGVVPQPMVMYPEPMMYTYPAVVTSTTITQPQQNVQQPQQLPTPAPQQAAVSESDINALKDMFPAIDKEIIQSVLAGCGGNVDAAVGNLLSMSEGQ